MAMKIMPKTLPGALHNLNKGSCDWGWQGLVAYGCQNVVVIVDPTSVQIVQVLDCRSGYIVKVKWARENYRHNLASPYGLRLAAADHNGHIYIWDAVSGKVGADCCDGTKPVSDMEWVGVQDISHDLLLALHPPYHLVLWNTENGSRLWRKTYADLFQSFSFDPFDPARVAFLGQDFVVFVDDFSLTKAPNGTGKKFFISSPSTQVTSSTSLDRLNTEKRLSKSTLKRVSGILVGESSRRLTNAEEDGGLSSTATTPSSIMAGGLAGNSAHRESATCLQLEFHKARRHHLILLYSREILVLDLEINQTVGIISTERTGSPFIKVVSICQRDALLCLHENGTLALRAQKCTGKMAAEASPCTQSLFADYFGGLSGSAQNNELIYEHFCQSDALRVTKHSRVLAMSACPVSEKRVALILSTGRILVWEVQAFYKKTQSSGAQVRNVPFSSLALCDLVLPASNARETGSLQRRNQTNNLQNSLKFVLVGLLSSLHPGSLVIRMCPPLTTRNFDHYQPLLAVGSSGGSVQIFNLSGGQLFKELSVHSSPVRGIEWVGLKSFLSFAYQNPLAGGSGVMRNELMLTDLDSGRSVSLRGGTNEEEPPIEQLKVSYLKQYFCLSMKDRPLEIWDVRTQTILRQMPKNFPIVTALEWSPSHNIKNLKKKSVVPSTEVDGNQGSALNPSDLPLVDVASPTGQSQASTPTANETGIMEPEDLLPTSFKEHFVFTDTSGLLYHYIVEGSMIKEGSKIPPDASMGSISGIAWKSETLVLTDMDGNMNIWDLKGRISRTVPTGRGGIKKVKFAPGRGNMKLLLLFGDGVEVWDAKDTLRISSVRCPRDISSISAVDWAASDRPVLACGDGTIRITDFDLSYYSSTMEDNQVDPFFCPHVLVPKAGFLLKSLIQHQPWRSNYGLDAEEFASTMKDTLSQCVVEQIDLIDPDLKKYLCSARFGTPERCLQAAKLFGDESEFVFWSVALFYMKFLKERSGAMADVGPGSRPSIRPVQVASEGGSGDQMAEDKMEVDGKIELIHQTDYEPLETCFDILCESSVFKSRELSRVRLHESKRGNGEQARRCADSLILLGQTDRAVQLLLETEPESPNYYADSLKACLAASIRSSGASQSTIKLVATNLIANGQLSEGIQLLCMIDKGLDACRYLQTYGKWFQAAWLAKVSLDEKECNEVLKRWADHLASPQVDQKDKAILVLLSLGQLEKAFEIMYSQRYFDRAALFLESCQEFGLKLNAQVSSSSSSGLLTNIGDAAGPEAQNTEWSTMVTSTYLEYARNLLNLGLIPACDYFCKKAGPKGETMMDHRQATA